MSNLFDEYRDCARAPLAQARSLPFAVYHDEAVYQQEMEAVFRHEWVVVCAERELPQAGDYFAFTLAGEAVAIVRGRDGTLRALSNNCRHRGTPLLDEGFGKLDGLIVCPYHAWAYDDHGALRGAPLQGVIQIDKAQHGLAQFALDTCLGLVWIHLQAEPPPLAQRTAGLADYANIFEPERFVHAHPGASEHWEANWKLALENAMESYHLFQVHRQTLETVTPSRGAYYVAGSSAWSVTGGEMIDHSSALSRWLRGDYPAAYHHYILLSLPPSFVGIMSYESFGWLMVTPTGRERCTIRAGALSAEAGVEDTQSAAFTAAFFAEDKAICERVQRGMHSRRGCGGKLVELERVVVDFHQFLAASLFASAPDAFYRNPQPTVFSLPEA